LDRLQTWQQASVVRCDYTDALLHEPGVIAEIVPCAAHRGAMPFPG